MEKQPNQPVLGDMQPMKGSAAVLMSILKKKYGDLEAGRMIAESARKAAQQVVTETDHDSDDSL